MSNPENILANYSTYSYHHVLIACETTKVAENLGNSVDMYQYIRPDAGSPQEKPVIIDTNPLGKYTIIANGMTDADFIIDNLKITSVTNTQPGPKNHEQFAALLTEGSFQIMEPKGINFFNVLGEIFDDFLMEPSGVVFMLKTFFVGNGDNDISQPVLDVKPFMFTITNIASTFDTTGGLYDIRFVSMSNGTAKLPQFVAGAHQVTIETTSKLPEALKTLQESIQRLYQLHYEKLEAKININDVGNLNPRKPPGQRINHIITYDAAYEDYNLDQGVDVQAARASNRDTVLLTFGTDPSIEKAILKVMRLSTQCGDDAEGKNKEGLKFLPKISSALETEKVGDIVKYTLVYHVNRATVPVVEKSATDASSDEEFVKTGKGIIFDYQFSGKNIDIINFDMQMKLGLAFLHTLQPTEYPTDVNNSLAVRDNNQDTGTNTSGKTAVRNNSPILFSTIAKSLDLKSKNYPLNSVSFDSLMERQSALETVSVTATIIGNPRLFSNSIMLPSEIGIEQPLIKPEDFMADWGRTPGLAKINIFMPINSSSTHFDTKQFWYRGWYYIIEVEHIFSGGEFTQILHLNSMLIEPFVPNKDTLIEKPKPTGSKKVAELTAEQKKVLGVTES